MKTHLSLIFTFALTLLFFAFPSSVHAHKLNTSYTNLIAEDDTLKVRVRMDDFDLLKIGIDQNGDSLLYYEEMEAGLDDIFAFVEEQMRLRANGEPLTLVRDRGDITPDNKGNMFANVYFSAELEEPVNELDVWVGWPERFGDAHKNLAKIMLPGQPLVQAVFSAGIAAADLCWREVAVGPSIRVHGARGGAYFPRLRPRHVSAGADRGGRSAAQFGQGRHRFHCCPQHYPLFGGARNRPPAEPVDRGWHRLEHRVRRSGKFSGSSAWSTAG